MSHLTKFFGLILSLLEINLHHIFIEFKFFLQKFLLLMSNVRKNILATTQVDENGLVYGLFIDGKRCQNGIFTAVNRPCLPVIPGAVIRHRKRD